MQTLQKRGRRSAPRFHANGLGKQILKGSHTQVYVGTVTYGSGSAAMTERLLGRILGTARAFAKRHNRAGQTPFDPHQFYPAAWTARQLAQLRPSLHVDVGSCATEVGVFSAFMPVIFVAGEALQTQLPGLATLAGDVTRLPFPDKTLVSLSALNVIERVGNGDPDESIKGLGELQRVLGYRGSLYLSTLVGRERVVKARRIFAPETILRAVPQLRLRRFSYIGDDLLPRDGATLEAAAQQRHACGLFEFQRA